MTFWLIGRYILLTLLLLCVVFMFVIVFGLPKAFIRPEKEDGTPYGR